MEKKREMSRPRKVDVSGAIDVARHPRVVTLELLLTRHPFERHPRAQKSPASPHLRLPCRGVSRRRKPQCHGFCNFLSTDARNESRIDDPQVVSINERICIAREIIITESVYIYISLSACSRINSANFFKRSPSFSVGMHYMNKSRH